MAGGFPQSCRDAQLLALGRGATGHAIGVQPAHQVAGSLARHRAPRSLHLPDHPDRRRPRLSARRPKRWCVSSISAGRRFRDRQRSERPQTPAIALTALHTLAITFLPQWLTSIRARLGPMTTRVLPENFNICVQALVEGGYDFFLTFHHPGIPVPLDPSRFPISWSGATISPRSPAGPGGGVAAEGRMPLLQYSRGSFLGLLASIAQGQEGAPPVYVAHTNENSMAEAMKFMALEGHGIAWLPRGLSAATSPRARSPSWRRRCRWRFGSTATRRGRAARRAGLGRRPASWREGYSQTE